MTTYFGKSCSFCLPRVPFVNCRQFMYLVISLLVLRAGYGIWLYQFLIIAYLFTLDSWNLIGYSKLPGIKACFLQTCKNMFCLASKSNIIFYGNEDKELFSRLPKYIYKGGSLQTHSQNIRKLQNISAMKSKTNLFTELTKRNQEIKCIYNKPVTHATIIMVCWTESVRILD